MKLTIFIVNALVVLGSPISPNLPDKLRQYQKATGISETELLTIYQNHLSGQFKIGLGFLWFTVSKRNQKDNPLLIFFRLFYNRELRFHLIEKVLLSNQKANFPEKFCPADNYHQKNYMKNYSKYSLRKTRPIFSKISTDRHSIIWRCSPRSIWNRAS